MAGVAGIEPALTVLETAVLPLNYSPIWRRREDSNLRYGIAVQQFSKLPPSTTRSLLHVVGVAGLEPAKTEVA